MTGDELRELVAHIQQTDTEQTAVEVKAAHGGTPHKPVREAMSAFANRSGGGVIVLGLDEAHGFQAVGVGDAGRLQREIADLASNEMVPALRPEFTVVEMNGKPVVAVEVGEVSADQKPCYYRSAGLQGGSFIRVGPSNRRMSAYEIFGYQSAREQQNHDADPVLDATVDDLDRTVIDAYLRRLQRVGARAVAQNVSFDDALRQLRIVREVDGVPRPTLAGLLAFGSYPQAVESQLMVTFVQYYGTDDMELTPRGERFVDNRRFEGNVVEVIEDAVAHVLSRIRSSSLIEGIFRRDIPEYPEVAIREAVINAVAHRDYSQYVRGTQIQIQLFADRLEIKSPGGLYGNVMEEMLGDEDSPPSSSRNRLLIKFLEDLGLVENRGSGVRAMIGAMRQANLEPPRFEDRRTSFQVTFRNHTLMNPATVAWLNQFAGFGINDHQRLALAHLRHNEQIVNSDYRRLNSVDAGTATRELRGLVETGLVSQKGSGRWAFYTLDVAPDTAASPDREEKVLAFVREHGSINNAETRRLLKMDIEEARRLLTRMAKNRSLRREGMRRWTTYHLPE